MNDLFLYEARPSVRPEFSQTLWTRLTERKSIWNQLGQFIQTRRGFATALLVILVLVACAQQILNSTFHHVTDVNGISVYETHDFLNLDASEELRQYLNTPQFQSLDDAPRIPAEEAIDLSPYNFQQPSWLPDGLELVSQGHHSSSRFDFAFIAWYSEQRDTTLFLMMHQPNRSSLEEVHVFPGAWEVIDVNGTEVLVVRGKFELPFDSEEEARQYLEEGGGQIEQRWNHDAGVRLKWVYEGTHYELFEPFVQLPWEPDSEAYHIPEEDLLRIAASMIP